MKRALATLTLALAIFVPIGVLTAAAVSAQGYTAPGTVTVAGNGTVSFPVPGTAAAFTGTGTPGSTISFSQVAAPCPSLGGVGIRLSSTGAFNLHLTTGTLYLFNPNTGQCVQVASATAAGLYQVVAGAGVTTTGVGLPTTGGGGASHSSSGSALPLAIGFVLLALGSLTFAFRRRILQV